MPVGKFDRRRDAEWIENDTMISAKVEELRSRGAAVLSISEFMDMFNDTDDVVKAIDLNHYWMTYIKTEK